MDWNDTPEQAAFRAEVRAFVQERLPERYRRMAEGMGEASNPDGGTAPGGFWQLDRKSDDPERQRAAKEWSQALASRGWVAPHWPREYGGAGLTPLEQFIFNQEMAELGAPGVGGQGVSLIGPTLVVHGTEEQKQEHLSKILSGDVAWAQGYSEPGAGSDLASLQTRAVRDGDEYVLNGQKIWTSGAGYADWLFALVRTDPDAPKHRGISFLMMDIKTPGITIRPLMDASWHIPFNETFFEDARVPVGNRLGEENRGWYVAVTLLDFERSNINTAVALRRDINEIVEHSHTHEGRLQMRLHMLPTLRLEVADRYVETEVLFNFAFRIVSMQSRGVIPNYEASMNKLFGSDLRQSVPRTAVKTFGLYSHLWDPEGEHAPLRADFTQAYVRSIPATIAGGSNEVQRNIIATRGLGLPRG
jgi:alkylation response protein AidB-like acyl-CoA dehydrogenase